MSTEITVAQPQRGLLAPVATPQQFMEAANAVTHIITKCLEEEKDYGVIPGTKASTLLKPGAEKLCAAFGLVPHYSIQDSEVDHDRWVTHKYGKSQGLYRYTVLCELKNREGVPYGTGLASCSTMESKYISRPRDCENTALKMAQKRALVGAVLNCFSLSNRFTQDLEDIKENEAVSRQAPTRAAPKAKESYDKDNKEHQDRLIELMTKMGIPDGDWDDISDLMHGKQSSELSSVVKLYQETKAL